MDPYGHVDTGARPGIGFLLDHTDGKTAIEECDLHWHMLHDCCFDGAEEAVWSHAEPMTVLGRPFVAPDATDMLMHVCVHGSAYNPMPPVRWIADAATILRSAGARVDWERLLTEADERLLLIVVREAVRHLRELAEADIPDWVVARLAAARVSIAEKREYRHRLVDQNYLRTVSGRWCQLSRQYRHAGALRRMGQIPSFMQQIWSVPRKSALPAIIAFRVLPAYFSQRNQRVRQAAQASDVLDGEQNGS
jgi:hypothetical protein